MRNRWRALAVLLAVLVVGLLLGVIGSNLWQSEIRGIRGERESSRFQSSSERMAQRLQLSSEQQAQLDSILEELRARIQATREKMGKEFDQVRAQTNEKIAAILTDEQRLEFEELLKEGESHRRSGEGRPYRGNQRPQR